MLNERLELPSVPTWWCGEEAARESALETLGEAFIIPTWPGVDLDGHSPRGFGDGLQPLADWQKSIEAMPDAFTIRRALSRLARAALRGEHDRGTLVGAARLRDRRHERRLVGDAGGLHAPGARRSRRYRCSTAAAASNVGAVEPSELYLLAASHADDARTRAQASDGIEPRGGELFWAGRYSERAENNVRLVRVILSSLESNDAEGMLDTMVSLASQSGLLPPGTPLVGHPPLRSNGSSSPISARRARPRHRQNLASQARASGEIAGASPPITGARLSRHATISATPSRPFTRRRASSALRPRAAHAHARKGGNCWRSAARKGIA